jgi:putative endonuclease
MGAFVYMLRCVDGSLYVGSATGNDVAPRVDQHNAGAFAGGYTWSRRPVTLI